MTDRIFRGKTYEDGEWAVSGSIVSYMECDGSRCCFIPRSKSECVFHIDENENAVAVEGMLFRVIPETIGQFIGKLDKNGDRIFEGDIVAYRGDENGVIDYDEESARFCVVFDTWSTDFDHLYGKELEVVGNIHDNPELMEEGK